MVSMMKAPSKSPGACFERIMLGKQPCRPKWRHQNQVSNYWMIMKIRLEATGIYRASQPWCVLPRCAHPSVYWQICDNSCPNDSPKHKLWTTCRCENSNQDPKPSKPSGHTYNTPLLLYSATAHEGCRSNWPRDQVKRWLGKKMPEI